MNNRLVCACVFLFGLTGCSTPGGSSFGQTSGSQANLTKNNYRILKTGVTGESSGFTLFWFIPIVTPEVGKAKAQIYEKLRNEGIKLEGRPIALANATEDRGGVNVILFGIPRIMLTTDVIEYLEDSEVPGASSKPKSEK